MMKLIFASLGLIAIISSAIGLIIGFFWGKVYVKYSLEKKIYILEKNCVVKGHIIQETGQNESFILSKGTELIYFDSYSEGYSKYFLPINIKGSSVLLKKDPLSYMPGKFWIELEPPEGI